MTLRLRRHLRIADIRRAADRLRGHDRRDAADRIRRRSTSAMARESCSSRRRCSAPARSSSAAPTTRSRRCRQEERSRGVVAFSSGNHAQGVASSAALFGIDALIAMPTDAPAIKVNNVKKAGAKVVHFDRFRDDRMTFVKPYLDEGRILVPPYDDPAIIAGQGTVGLELMAQAERLGVEARRRHRALRRRRADRRHFACRKGRLARHGGLGGGAGEFRRHPPLACGRAAVCPTRPATTRSATRSLSPSPA